MLSPYLAAPLDPLGAGYTRTFGGIKPSLAARLRQAHPIPSCPPLTLSNQASWRLRYLSLTLNMVVLGGLMWEQGAS